MWIAFYTTGLLASLVASVYYSVTARARGIHPLASRMILGKMNIALGTLVMLFGINQFTFDTLDALRVAVGLVLVVVGAINLIFGVRNYRMYQREWKRAEEQNS